MTFFILASHLPRHGWQAHELALWAPAVPFFLLGDPPDWPTHLITLHY